MMLDRIWIWCLCGWLLPCGPVCHAQMGGGRQRYESNGPLAISASSKAESSDTSEGVSYTPLPSSGQSALFQYEESDQEGVYVVTPDGGDSSLLISESFLSRLIEDPRLTEERVAIAVAAYPTLITHSFQTSMDRAYPTQAEYDGMEFQTMLLEGEQSGSADLQQDSLAGPYVRITLKDEYGNPETFSISRSVVDSLVANGNLTDERVIDALRSYPFHLPEEARYGFAARSHEDLVQMALKLPNVSRQEFVQLHELQYGKTNAADAVTKLRNLAEVRMAMASNAPLPTLGPSTKLLPHPAFPLRPPPEPAAARSVPAPKMKQTPRPAAETAQRHIGLWIVAGVLLSLTAFWAGVIFQKKR